MPNESMTEPIAKAVKKKKGKRNGSSALALAREFQKRIEISTAKLVEFVKEEREKSTREAAEIVNALIVAEARERDDNARVRSDLNTVSGGAMERLVRVSSYEDIKTRLRDKGWRV
jgi:undecaprenyl pyrophosphate synthase